jgi:hypothetical protein
VDCRRLTDAEPAFRASTSRSSFRAGVASIAAAMLVVAGVSVLRPSVRQSQPRIITTAPNADIPPTRPATRGLGCASRCGISRDSYDTEAFAMKKIIFGFAALALSAATHQALACDWGLHADSSSATVVACDNSGCAPVPPTQQSAAPTIADEAASPTPTAVAEK